MNKEQHLASKAQAQAVRKYLGTLGIAVTHVQALEVIARGVGARSRHAMPGAQPDPATPGQGVDGTVDGSAAPQPSIKNHGNAASAEGPGHWTEVAYRYVDGSNCKRHSQMVFHGRLTKAQLLLIQHKLDDGVYFVPAQVGFESLLLAFTDDGGDDHAWHTLELGDEDRWVLDADGYVLSAGDVQQLRGLSQCPWATDADCDNLMWRFARVMRWNPDLQTDVVRADAWQRPEAHAESPSDASIAELSGHWSKLPGLRSVAHSTLTKTAEQLLSEGFRPVPGLAHEMRRPLGPNAYQFVILESEDDGRGEFRLNFDVTTLDGKYLTYATALQVEASTHEDTLQEAMRQLSEQQRAARVMPETWVELDTE